MTTSLEAKIHRQTKGAIGCYNDGSLIFLLPSRPLLPGLQSLPQGLDLPLQALLPSGDVEDENEGQDPKDRVSDEEVNQIPHDDNPLSA
jgi:hypothetical protein